ncbi:MAG TPA: sodium/solute symporter [Kiritimatiellia bacterium]|nr:sodium/solute symporter [Kiritimatiellia bacterium]HRU71095.1 sodium/solute symporter [Kiritimatiellia bacterium]
MGITLDYVTIAIYFVVLLGVGFLTGRGKRASSDSYFLSKGTLPWWVIGAAYVATGMNTEQLIGQNGVGYQSGLVMANWYLAVPVVYGALIYFFYPVYLRNGIRTMPEYLGKRFNGACQNVFAVFLIVSYVLMNLAVVFYGGAVLLANVFPLVADNSAANLWLWLAVLSLVSGLYTMYGGESSMVYGAFIQFLLIFVAGVALIGFAYCQMPGGLSDLCKVPDPGYLRLIHPMASNPIPWHAILVTMFGLHLYYSCINQSLVQRGFGARTEWDARMAIVFAGAFVLLRPFVEIIPGMMARAIYEVSPDSAIGQAFDFGLRNNLSGYAPDRVLPKMISTLVPSGLQGLMVVGILAGVMSTISALLNSISTLFTYDVYKKWINPRADDKRLVMIGSLTTLTLMVFSIGYAPQIQRMGGIFVYFQTAASYFAVPIASVFLMGMFWKRTTPAAALAVILCGIPCGMLLDWYILEGQPLMIGGRILIPQLLPTAFVEAWNTKNIFVCSGINQAFLMLVMGVISLFTRPRPEAEIRPLMWSVDKFFLPPGEPKHPLLQSVGFWFVILTFIYVVIYVISVVSQRFHSNSP